MTEQTNDAPRIRIKMSQSTKGVQSPEFTIEHAGASIYPQELFEADMETMWRWYDIMRAEADERHPQTEA